MSDPFPLFETVLVDPSLWFGARIISVPKRSVEKPEWFLPQNADDFAGMLHLTRIHVPSASFIPYILAATAGAKDSADVVQRIGGMFQPSQQLMFSTLDPAWLNFVDYVAFKEVIPFESSPYDVKSIISALAGAASAESTGAIAGFVTGWALGGVWVMFTVPAGMILATVAHHIDDLIKQTSKGGHSSGLTGGPGRLQEGRDKRNDPAPSPS